MTVVRFSDVGPDPLLGAGEYLTCVACGTIYEHAEANELTEYGDGQAKCDGCGSFKGFVRRSHDKHTSLEERWGKRILADGYVAIPLALFEQVKNLGDDVDKVDATDMWILAALFSHARKAGDAPWPSVDRLAAMGNISDDSVSRRLKKLERLGLVEQTPRRNPKTGKVTTTAKTWNGLVEKLNTLLSESHTADCGVEAESTPQIADEPHRRLRDEVEERSRANKEETIFPRGKNGVAYIDGHRAPEEEKPVPVDRDPFLVADDLQDLQEQERPSLTRDALLAQRCRCVRPIPGMDEDGDDVCVTCGHLLAAPKARAA